jgi:hypothetical protein
MRVQVDSIESLASFINFLHHETLPLVYLKASSGSLKCPSVDWCSIFTQFTFLAEIGTSECK